MIFISLVIPIISMCIFSGVLICCVVCMLKGETMERNSSGTNEVRSEIPNEVTRRLFCECYPCVAEQSAPTVLPQILPCPDQTILLVTL